MVLDQLHSLRQPHRLPRLPKRLFIVVERRHFFLLSRNTHADYLDEHGRMTVPRTDLGVNFFLLPHIILSWNLVLHSLPAETTLP
jgi:hypothetical protein